MRRRRLTYFFLATALGLWSGMAPGQSADYLRRSIGDIAGTEDQAGDGAATPSPVPTAELPEEEPPPRKKPRVQVDPYEPLGVGNGGLRVFPVLRLGGVYSDNIGRTTSNRQSDIGLRLRPLVRVESDWVRHSFDATGSGDFIIYNKHSDFDVTSGDIDVNSRIDVRRDSRIDINGFYGATQLGAAESDFPDDFVGLRTDQDFGGSVSWSQGLGRFQTKLGAGVTRSIFGEEEFSNGTVQDNKDRNYAAPRISLRGSYGVSAALRPFVEIAYEPRFHDRKLDRNGLRRDSDGYEAIAGFAFNADPIWLAELGVTYQRRDFEDDQLASINAVGLTGNVTWRPSELTSVKLTADTTIAETASAINGGNRNYDLTLDIAHDWRENITLLAGLGVNYEEIPNFPDDVRYTGNLGITYRFNPWLAWTASYDVFYFDSGSPGSDYTENRFTVGIELRR